MLKTPEIRIFGVYLRNILEREIKKYTGCLKIREFRIQSVVGDHFSSPNMEIKKKNVPYLAPNSEYDNFKTPCIFFRKSDFFF
jgi:hypothetical protein